LFGNFSRTPATQGWREAFRAAGAIVDDELLLEITEPSQFDRKEWRW
jgi:hypothetical protein